MTVYSELTFYSPLLDAEAIRLSVPDSDNREFFMIVPKPERGYRQVREQALETICRAIDMGLEPGEVVI